MYNPYQKKSKAHQMFDKIATAILAGIAIGLVALIGYAGYLDYVAKENAKAERLSSIHSSDINCKSSNRNGDWICVVKATGETLSLDEVSAYLERI